MTEVRLMYQSRAASPCDSKVELALLKHNLKKGLIWMSQHDPGLTARLSLCLSSVNNKRGRKKYIYYDNDRHQATQT